MPRHAPRRPSLRVEPLEDRTVPAAVSWDGGGGNLNWNTAANWSTDTLPGAADDVTIDIPGGDFTITSTANVTINSLTSAETVQVTGNTFTVAAASSAAGYAQTGGTLTANGRLTVTGSFAWSAGTVRGAAGVELGVVAVGSLTGAGAKLLGTTLTNNGQLTYSGSGWLFGPAAAEVGAVENEPGATLTLDGDGDLANNFAGAHRVLNRGAVVHTGAGTTAFNGVDFDNPGGVIDVQAGTFDPNGGGTFAGGTLQAAAGAVLDLSGLTLSGAFVGAGDGRVTINGATTIDPAGATFDLPAPLLEWQSGSLTGGPLANDGVLRLTGAGTKILGLALTNRGQTTYTGTNWLFGPAAAAAGVFANEPGATLTLDGDGDLANNFVGAHRVVNRGAVVRTGAGTTTVTGVAFDNDGGTVDVLAGTLQLAGGGSGGGPPRGGGGPPPPGRSAGPG